MLALACLYPSDHRDDECLLITLQVTTMYVCWQVFWEQCLYFACQEHVLCVVIVEYVLGYTLLIHVLLYVTHC